MEIPKFTTFMKAKLKLRKVKIKNTPIKATYHLSYFLFRPSVCTILCPRFCGQRTNLHAISATEIIYEKLFKESNNYYMLKISDGNGNGRRKDNNDFYIFLYSWAIAYIMTNLQSFVKIIEDINVLDHQKKYRIFCKLNCTKSTHKYYDI